MLCTNINVTTVAHCMLVKHARHTHTRISEHMEKSKTGNKLSVSQMSAVLTHHHFSGHTIPDSDFTILTSGNTIMFDLKMRESLLNSKFKPILNNNISSTPLYPFYSLIPLELDLVK
jgi:hypothetical protein